jgi:hypothetical protein
MTEQHRIQEGWAALWRYAESSLYAERIKRYLKVFGRDQVQILLFEDLSASPHLVMHDLFQFLGVDASFCPDTTAVYNRSGRPKSKILADFIAKPNVVTTLARRLLSTSIRTSVRLALLHINTGEKGQMDNASREYLQEYFRRDVDEVENIVGKELQWLQWEKTL